MLFTSRRGKKKKIVLKYHLPPRTLLLKPGSYSWLGWKETHSLGISEVRRNVINILYTFPTYISQEPSKLNINRPVFFSFFFQTKEPILPRPQLKTESHKTGRREPKCFKPGGLRSPTSCSNLTPATLVHRPPSPQIKEILCIYSVWSHIRALDPWSCSPQAPSGLLGYDSSCKSSWNPLLQGALPDCNRDIFPLVLKASSLALAGPECCLTSPASSLSDRLAHPAPCLGRICVCQPWGAVLLLGPSHTRTHTPPRSGLPSRFWAGTLHCILWTTLRSWLQPLPGAGPDI